MKRKLYSVGLVMALAAMVMATPAITQAPPAPAAQTPAGTATNPDTVVARVGDAEITTADIAVAYAELPEQYRQLPLSVLYNQLLDQLINRELMLRAGREQKLDEDETIQAQVKQFEDFAIQRAYLDRFISETVTEDKLRKQYDATIGAEKGKEQVKASHILLQSEAEANAIIKELADGADFAQLARDRSTGPSAPQGGDLGYFNREQMVTEFADAAYEMEEGEVSSVPVKTQFGWHVIKVTGRRTLPPPTFEEVRERILDQLTREVLQTHMADLQSATTVERFNPDGSPMKAEANAAK